MTDFRDPGDEPRGRSRRRSDLKAPEPPNLFDISDQPPPTPMQVKSGTSIDTAKEIRDDVLSARRAAVEKIVRAAGPAGIARFQVAEKLGVPSHWVTSSVLALIEMRRIEERPEGAAINPASGKRSALLIGIESCEVRDTAA